MPTPTHYSSQNSTTGETSWDTPAGFGGGGTDAAGGRSSSDSRRATVFRRSGVVKRSTARPQTVGERLATRAQKFIMMRKADKGKLQPSAFAKRKGGGGGGAAPVSARPPSAPGARAEASPWQAVNDPSSGSVYYYNATTGEVRGGASGDARLPRPLRSPALGRSPPPTLSSSRPLLPLLTSWEKPADA